MDSSVNNESLDKESKNKRTTPTMRVKFAKASTPLSSSDTVFNCSGVSSINANDKQPKKNTSKPRMKRYSLALTNRSTATHRDLRDAMSIASSSVAATREAMPLLPLGHDKETKAKEIEETIMKARLLQAMFLEHQAKETLKKMDEESFEQIQSLMMMNTEMRKELQELQKSTNSLENTIETISCLEKQKAFLKEYSNRREELVPLFDALEKQINSQKMLLKINTSSGQMVHDLIRSADGNKRLDQESIVANEKLSASAFKMEEFCSKIKELDLIKSDFNKYVAQLNSLLNKMSNYQSL